MLQEAKVTCIGNARDEAVCQEVARVLLEAGRLPAVVRRAYKRQRLEEGVTSSRTIRNLLQEQQGALEKDGRYFDDSTSDGEDEAESSRPWVPADVRTAIRRRREAAIGEARHGVIRTALKSAVEGGLHSLPVYRVDPRVASRARADSVKRGCLQAWLDSEAGQEWSRIRRQRLEVDAEP